MRWPRPSTRSTCKYTDALAMADNTITYRIVVKEVAREYGVYATFMPKPMFGVNGSGMHVHQSLFKGKKNAFYDAKDKYYLSTVGKCYIAGLLKHAREITLLTSQWVNSYKRLVPGYEAPGIRGLGEKEQVHPRQGPPV